MLPQFYYLFGFLFLVFIILIITCAEITIVLCYFQLCSEDYHWWCTPLAPELHMLVISKHRLHLRAGVIANFYVLMALAFCRWRAYFTSGSSALYLFLYSAFYFWTKLDITKTVPMIMYFRCANSVDERS